MERQTALFLKSLPDAVLVVGRDGSITFANERAEGVFGYDAGALIGLSVEALVPTRLREKHGGLRGGYLSSDPVIRPMGSGRELPALRADGQEILVEVALGPASAGTGAIAMIRDMTAVVNARKARQKEAELFRIAALHAADYLSYTNLSEDRYDWYGDIDRGMGYEVGQFPRRRSAWLKLIHPDDVDELKAGIERVIENKERGWRFRYRVRHGDGSYRHWLDRGSVTGRIGDGRPNEGRGAIVDETERVLARETLESTLARAVGLRERMQAESEYLQAEIQGDHDFEEFVGQSVAINAMLRRVEEVGRTDSPVLLLGEVGSGKELLARAIHARGARAGRPLIKVDCRSLPSGLIESELFGHEKGAFTGAHMAKAGRLDLADEGTVFLSGIDEVPLDLQAKLLRLLEEGVFRPLGSQGERRVDVRVIAASHRDLQKDSREGRFRSDLYDRLGGFPIEIPPLRERRDDIPLLVSHFVARLGASLGKPARSVARSSMDALVEYDWPGNVRELKNVIERSLILCTGDVLTVEEAVFRGVAVR